MMRLKLNGISQNVFNMAKTLNEEILEKKKMLKEYTV